MQGFQVTFYTAQDRHHKGAPMGQWLLDTARALGLRGATLYAAAEGFGADRRVRSAHFFELSEQPIEVTVAATPEEIDRLFDVLKQENVRVFYVKTAIDFGLTGDSA
jgi:PII-like signaling protein